jgi:mono/diheme cytochrome c family protein
MKAAILCGVLCAAAPSVLAAADPATTFARKCTSCHTFGRGTLVGPDLKGVTSRHTRAWLTAWISSSDKLIRAGDPAAAELFTRFKSQRMPDQPLNPAEISALLNYLEAGGPEADALRKNRHASSATPAEVELGRLLFVGQRGFANGDAPCSACHRAGGAVGFGGTLGPDLAAAYARHHDTALATVLTRGCVPRARPALGATELTDQEAFAVRAFLSRTMTVPR